jgi:hypothetical protein
MKLTPRQLLEIRGNAMSRWHSMPVETSLPGSADYLTSDQRVTIAWMEACTQFLHANAGGPNVGVDIEVGIEENVE